MPLGKQENKWADKKPDTPGRVTIDLTREINTESDDTLRRGPQSNRVGLSFRHAAVAQIKSLRPERPR